MYVRVVSFYFTLLRSNIYDVLSSFFFLSLRTLQLILKSKTAVPLTMHYMVLRGPYSDIKVGAKIYKWEFTEEANEAPFTMLPLKDNAECNRLLAAKAINFR